MPAKRGETHSLFGPEDAKQFLEELLVALRKEFPFAAGSTSSLGGPKHVGIYLSLSLDPREDWSNGIFENSRGGKFTLKNDGVIEQLTLHHSDHRNREARKKLKFRKGHVKDMKSLVKKLSQWKDKGLAESIQMSTVLDSIEESLEEGIATKDAKAALKAMKAAAKGYGAITAWAEQDDAYLVVSNGSNEVSFSFYADGRGGTLHASQDFEEVRGRKWEISIDKVSDVSVHVKKILNASKKWLKESFVESRDLKRGGTVWYRGEKAEVVDPGDRHGDGVVIKLKGEKIHTSWMDPALGAKNRDEYKKNMATLKRALR